MPCGRSAAARSGQRPSVVTSVLATTVLLTNASVQAPCPVVALRHFEHAAGPVGCGDVVREILLISQHDAAARDTDKVHARLGHMSQRLNHTPDRPGWRAGAGWRLGPRDQSPWPVRCANMARHCSVEIAAVIVLDHGPPAGTCRAPITANFRWWAAARPLGHPLGVRRAYASRSR